MSLNEIHECFCDLLHEGGASTVTALLLGLGFLTACRWQASRWRAAVLALPTAKQELETERGDLQKQVIRLHQTVAEQARPEAIESVKS